jgi:hypothetical protein
MSSDRYHDLLADFVKREKAQADKKDADNQLAYARGRLKKVIGRIFENEIEKLKELIAEPNRYSTKEWEKVITDLEWTARRFLNVAERMEQVRPLTRIDDTVVDARVMCKRLLAETFME